MSQKHETTLQHLVGSRVRARLIRSLVAFPGRRPYFRELCGEAGSGVSFVRRELLQLQSTGLIESDRRDGRVYFHVNIHHPLYQPLRDLIRAADAVDSGQVARSARPWVMYW